MGYCFKKMTRVSFNPRREASPLTTIPYEVLFANNFKFQSQAGSLSTDHRHVYLPCSALTRGFNPRREASPLTTRFAGAIALPGTMFQSQAGSLSTDHYHDGLSS